MALKIDAKFKGKVTGAFKNGMRKSGKNRYAEISKCQI